jgi:hypothetical protein
MHRRGAIPADLVPDPSPALQRLVQPARASAPTPACRCGCGQAVPRPNLKYATPACRERDLRPIYARRSRERLERSDRPDDVVSTPELRAAFRLATARVPSAEWPSPAREAYNAYARPSGSAPRRPARGATRATARAPGGVTAPRAPHPRQRLAR